MTAGSTSHVRLLQYLAAFFLERDIFIRKMWRKSEQTLSKIVIF